MEQSSFEFDTRIVEAADLHEVECVAKDMLETYGVKSDEYGIEKVLNYHTDHTERYHLTAQEAVYVDSQQLVSIFSVVKPTGNYKKGIYIDVWTKIGDEDNDASDTYYWRNTQYGLLKNGQFYVADDFQMLSESGAPRTWFNTENQNVRESQRLEDMLTIEQSLGPDFTVTDYIELCRILAGMNPANIFHG